MNSIIRMRKAGWNIKILAFVIDGIILSWVILSIAVVLGLLSGIYAQIAFWLAALALTGLAFNAWQAERWENSVACGVLALWFGVESIWPYFPIFAQWANIGVALIFLWATITTTKKLLP